MLTGKRETTGAVAMLRLSADRLQLAADGEDVSVVRVEAVDANGRIVPTAKELVNFQISGEGASAGVGNGDPNCLESDKEPKRSVFNGLAQLIVQSTGNPGGIHLLASFASSSLSQAPIELVLTTVAVFSRLAVAAPAQAAERPESPAKS